MGVSNKVFASLSPGLLARKGGAKPAMRQKLQPIEAFHKDLARQEQDDLGWNDDGDEPYVEPREAEVLPINGADLDIGGALAQQQKLASRLQCPAPTRRSALDDGRRAAFTLRIDAERHLKLRLASTVMNRSAQQLVIEALDNLLNKIPDIQSLAESVRNRG